MNNAKNWNKARRILLMTVALMACGVSRADADTEQHEEAQVSSARSTPEQTKEEPLVAPALPHAQQFSIIFKELNNLQVQEEALWKEHRELALALPASGIAFGAPAAIAMLSLGTFLQVTDQGKYGLEGALLIGGGVLAMAGTILCGWQVARVRKKRIALESELRALGKTRISVTRVLGAQWLPNGVAW
jgi:hypothetical protein